MTAMGALTLKVDDKIQQGLRNQQQQQQQQDEPLDVHRRRSVSLAFNDITANIQGH